jgi:hypothetical protein
MYQIKDIEDMLSQVLVIREELGSPFSLKAFAMKDPIFSHIIDIDLLYTMNAMAGTYCKLLLSNAVIAPSVAGSAPALSAFAAVPNLADKVGPVPNCAPSSKAVMSCPNTWLRTLAPLLTEAPPKANQ